MPEAAGLRSRTSWEDNTSAICVTRCHVVILHQRATFTIIVGLTVMEPPSERLRWICWTPSYLLHKVNCNIAEMIQVEGLSRGKRLCSWIAIHYFRKPINTQTSRLTRRLTKTRLEWEKCKRWRHKDIATLQGSRVICIMHLYCAAPSRRSSVTQLQASSRKGKWKKKKKKKKVRLQPSFARILIGGKQSGEERIEEEGRGSKVTILTCARVCGW